MSNNRIRLPVGLDDEDIFFSMGPVKLSMRKLALITLSLMVWIFGAQAIVAPLLGINFYLSLLGMAWVPVVGFAMAFVKVRGFPIDTWVGMQFSYIFGARTYLAGQLNADGGVPVESDLYRDDDIETILQTMPSTQVYKNDFVDEVYANPRH